MISWILLCVYIAGLAAYFPLSHRVEFFSSQSPLDASIPLVPHFVIPYLLLPVVLIFALIVLWPTPLRDSYLISLVLVQWSAVVFWFLLPTGVVRPDIVGTDWFSNLIRFVYAHDGAVNAFPSSHVYLALVSGYFLILAFPAWIPLTSIVTIAIVFSTVLIKQHYALDIVGGVAWTATAIVLARLVINNVL